MQLVPSQPGAFSYPFVLSFSSRLGASEKIWGLGVSSQSETWKWTLLILIFWKEKKKIVPKEVKSYMERILKVTRTLEKLV